MVQSLSARNRRAAGYLSDARSRILTDAIHPQYAIAVLAKDRVGLVADIAAAVAALGGDIADLRQSVLRGYFTMLLLARVPGSPNPDMIQRHVAGASRADPAELSVSVRLASDALPADPGAASDHTYLLTARGPDRIGFVAAVAGFCAENDLNILDLSTAVDNGQYVMMLLVDVSRCNDLDALRRRLRAFGQSAGLEAVLQHEAIFRATNEVDQ
jgi:glycine cleavage system transcriptional repressor